MLVRGDVVGKTLRLTQLQNWVLTTQSIISWVSSHQPTIIATQGWKIGSKKP